MPGSAELGDNLVDDLIPDVIDGIRGELHPDLGVRQFRVFVVTRTYVTGEIGSDRFTDTEIELDPQPLVVPYSTAFELEPCGVDEAGFVKVKEVSLTFTEAELGSPNVNQPEGVELFVKLSDAQGQGIPDTFWRHTRRPFPDRIKDMGWILRLAPASIAEGL